MDSATEHILTINGGSSSIKFTVFERSLLAKVFEGKVDHIGMNGTYITYTDIRTGETKQHDIPEVDIFTSLFETINAHIPTNTIVGIGHRIVHGGHTYQETTHIDETLLQTLESLKSFAPRHLPTQIALVRALLTRFPNMPQYACFDTSFFKELPRIAQLLPIPRKYMEKGIRRYGFHGLSYEYLMSVLEEKCKVKVPSKRIILAHLGGGSSLAAVQNGKPVETTMGFSPNSGIPMSTRTGDLDSGFFEYCMETEHMTPEAFGSMVNHESGMLGISGTTADMEVLVAESAKDSNARETVSYFAYQVRKQIGALAAAMGGVDVLVFTGGIGEKSAPIREEICAALSFLNIELDLVANTESEMRISKKDSQCIIYVIPANEALTIARNVHTAL